MSWCPSISFKSYFTAFLMVLFSSTAIFLLDLVESFGILYLRALINPWVRFLLFSQLPDFLFIALCTDILFFTLYTIFGDTPTILETNFRVTSAFSKSLSRLFFCSSIWTKVSEKKLSIMLLSMIMAFIYVSCKKMEFYLLKNNSSTFLVKLLSQPVIFA